jgi:hypothetical protein
MSAWLARVLMTEIARTAAFELRIAPVLGSGLLLLSPRW